MSPLQRIAVLNVGLAFWLLLAPGENWTWVIVGGHELQRGCEKQRAARLDGDNLVCAVTGPWTAAQPSAANAVEPVPVEQRPSPSLARGNR
jgi:hypothetical protein